MFEWTWWVLLAAPLAWWLQATLHESSHLIVGVRRNGITPLKMVLWPHVYKGHFYGARLTYYRGRRDPKELMHIAPMWVGLKMMLFIGLLMLSASPHIRTILAPFWIVALFHVLSFWRGYWWGTDICDGKRWRNRASEYITIPCTDGGKIICVKDVTDHNIEHAPQTNPTIHWHNESNHTLGAGGHIHVTGELEPKWLQDSTDPKKGEEDKDIN